MAFQYYQQCIHRTRRLNTPSASSKKKLPEPGASSDAFSFPPQRQISSSPCSSLYLDGLLEDSDIGICLSAKHSRCASHLWRPSPFWYLIRCAGIGLRSSFKRNNGSFIMNLRLRGVLKGSRSPVGAALPVPWTGRDNVSRLISNPEHNSGFLPSYEVSPQWSTFRFPELGDWHCGCAASDLQQVRMPCQYGPKSPESNLQGTSLSPHPQEWRQLGRQTVAPSDSVTTGQIPTRPVINFNEW